MSVEFYRGSSVKFDSRTHCGLRRVGLKHNLDLKGWNSQVHREVPGKFESSNVSRDNVSRGIGRTWLHTMSAYAAGYKSTAVYMSGCVKARSRSMYVYIYIYIYMYIYTHTLMMMIIIITIIISINNNDNNNIINDIYTYRSGSVTLAP